MGIRKYDTFAETVMIAKETEELLRRTGEKSQHSDSLR